MLFNVVQTDRVAIPWCRYRVVHEVCATDPVLRELFCGAQSAVFTDILNVRPLSLDVMRHVVVPRCLPANWLGATGIKKWGGGPEERVVRPL